MLLFLPYTTLLSFLWIPCGTQDSPWIIKAPRPHLTSLNNEATLLPCPGLCEALKHLLRGLCVSRQAWAGGVSDPPQGSALAPFFVLTLSPVLGDTAGGHVQTMQSSLQPRTAGPN